MKSISLFGDVVLRMVLWGGAAGTILGLVWGALIFVLFGNAVLSLVGGPTGAVLGGLLGAMLGAVDGLVLGVITGRFTAQKISANGYRILGCLACIVITLAGSLLGFASIRVLMEFDSGFESVTLYTLVPSLVACIVGCISSLDVTKWVQNTVSKLNTA